MFDDQDGNDYTNQVMGGSMAAFAPVLAGAAMIALVVHAFVYIAVGTVIVGAGYGLYQSGILKELASKFSNMSRKAKRRCWMALGIGMSAAVAGGIYYEVNKPFLSSGAKKIFNVAVAAQQAKHEIFVREAEGKVYAYLANTPMERLKEQTPAGQIAASTKAQQANSSSSQKGNATQKTASPKVEITTQPDAIAIPEADATIKIQVRPVPNDPKYKDKGECVRVTANPFGPADAFFTYPHGTVQAIVCEKGAERHVFAKADPKSDMAEMKDAQAFIDGYRAQMKAAAEAKTKVIKQRIADAPASKL